MRVLIVALLLNLFAAAPGAAQQPPSTVKFYKNPLALQYEEVDQLSKGIPKGAGFTSLSPETWKLMSGQDREGALKVLRKVQGSGDLSQDQKSQLWNQIIAKADISAAKKLGDTGLYPGLQVPAQSQPDKWVSMRWDEIAKNPVEKPFTIETATLLANYQSQIAARNLPPKYIWTSPLTEPVPKVPPTDDEWKNDINKIVLPGMPRPRPPGQGQPTTTGQVVATLSASRPPECLIDPANCKQRQYDAASIMLAKAAAAPTVAGHRRADPFNPLGFMEVVRILHTYAKLSCTGTLIAADLVLTARHCVFGYEAEDLFVNVPKYDENELANCEKAMAEKKEYRQCVGFTRHKLASNGIRMHEGADIALIKLAEPAASSPIAKVDLKGGMPAQISLVGYGDNGTRRTAAMQNAIEVGWYSGKGMQFNGGDLAWRFDPTEGASATCDGDSGGPIYSGIFSGYESEQAGKPIVAITSKADKAECKNHLSIQTTLASRTVKNWLCKQPDLPGNARENGCDRMTELSQATRQ